MSAQFLYDVYFYNILKNLIVCRKNGLPYYEQYSQKFIFKCGPKSLLRIEFRMLLANL